MIIDKIKSREELSVISADLRKKKKTIGFTSGAFDILHVGHVDYLEKAKENCDILIVGINTDDSVKKYKGDARPIVPQTQRAKTIAALACVDYVFLFSERRNVENLKALKPHLYIKAGDYKTSELTSAPVLENWGGKPLLIPISESISSSTIIEKIISLYAVPSTLNQEKEVAGVMHSTLTQKKDSSKKQLAVFLDRDGVINEDVHFLHDPKKFQMLPKVLEGIKRLQDMKYRLIIITNQAGIGLGYYTVEDFFQVNSEMLRQFSTAGIKIDKIYFCPHSESEKCTCRKPATGLILRAQEELNLDLSRSFIVGDQLSDIQAGKNAGLKTILIKNEKNKAKEIDADFIAETLVQATEFIKKNE